MDKDRDRDGGSAASVGILYPGEMGSSFGRLLGEAGFRVITTLEGRSPRTQRLCRDAGLTVLDSLGAVLDQADMVVSLVLPSAALPVAQAVAAGARSSGRKLLYVDANNISPAMVNEIAAVLRSGAIDLVDASLHGVASQLRQRGLLFLSGQRASELAGPLDSLLRVRIVGPTPGQASAIKMVLSGMSKGLIGLFVETMTFAHHLQCLDVALESCRTCYPGVMEAVARMLPTYPQHASRRSQELREIELAMLAEGFVPEVIHGVREVIARVAALPWDGEREPASWTIEEILREIYSGHALCQDISQSKAAS